jgi:hypothetical protein
LAQSRGTSNGPDWKDVTRAAQDYARIWDGEIKVLLRPGGSWKQPTLTMVAELWRVEAESGAPRLSASASVLLGGGGHSDIEMAALSVLYSLDQEVYRRESGVSPA